jgi:hypothetical protein
VLTHARRPCRRRCRITHGDEQEGDDDGDDDGGAQDSGRPPVSVQWRYQSEPYEPVELQCGDRLLISWERGVHNLVQDANGECSRLPVPLNRCCAAVGVAGAAPPARLQAATKAFCPAQT